ncbi:hypothetical protein DLI08_16635 [Vibrio parahaemolyticus]|nr:hypothetical protein [Vibrio parahaemolyticus]EGR2930768.1 hypothetical protein [Vibrio parahaemolyticus]EGR2954523.1 hypothetical protein [Vibrio parahaemolyticus]EGR2961076.1 hypothetical protein [Vibrio parahaemolyticus]EGR2966823.1 hypothetical protein [Vibrio parahaemolyticus]
MDSSVNHSWRSANQPVLRQLTTYEIEKLKRDMKESSACAKAELKRRRAAKNGKNSAHGIGDGIDNDRLSN